MTREQYMARYARVRERTEALAAPLSGEDQVLQSMPEASPTKWHRGHTTWFFETFLLKRAGEPAYDERYGFLFNSYYESVGERIPRPRRGMLSRPSAAEIGDYRRAVDHKVLELLRTVDEGGLASLGGVLELGLAHEEQHQELILTDILHAFSQSPLGPAYAAPPAPSPTSPPFDLRWTELVGGLVEIGAERGAFSFDNEGPRHRVFLEPYELASRPVSWKEVRAFIAEGGYDTPSLWLSEGYELAQGTQGRAPMYTRGDADDLEVFSLRGWRVPADDEPACHLSYWEADAVARFLGGRLPSEAEWEHAARDAPTSGNFSDGPLVPLPARAGELGQLFGDVWEWTRSSYDPYPGYRPQSGALGEYNGKFMAQQMVLRGGSCLTPPEHVRATYRNFWHPNTRFQATGLRLARDLGGVG